MKRFTLPENFKGRVINGHVFGEDRSLVVADDEAAAKMEMVLVRFYGCTVETIEPAPTEESEENSLVSTVTKDAS